MAGEPIAEDLAKRIEKLNRENFELKKSNKRLLEKEAECTAFVNALTETAVLIDLQDWHFLTCNSVAADRAGKRVDEVIGLSLYDYPS